MLYTLCIILILVASILIILAVLVQNPKSGMIMDRKGRGLLFTADAAKPMFFSALPYTPHEMESAKHPYELPPIHYTVIRAMGEQMGVGGDDSWGANVHPEYIPDVTKPVEFTFTFRGI